MGAILGAIWSWILHRLTGTTPPRSQEAVQSERAGADEVKLSTVTQTAKVQASVAQAEAEAPKDVAGVQAELHKGAF